MTKLKVKIVCGFRKDQIHSISADEAHKAYRIFSHPDERAIFSNGLALTGKSVETILPDYNGSMGWNQDHNLDGDDWNEIKAKGIDKELRDVLLLANNIAQFQPEKINIPLSKVYEELYSKELTDNNKYDNKNNQYNILDN